MEAQVIDLAIIDFLIISKAAILSTREAASSTWTASGEEAVLEVAMEAQLDMEDLEVTVDLAVMEGQVATEHQVMGLLAQVAEVLATVEAVDLLGSILIVILEETAMDLAKPLDSVTECPDSSPADFEFDCKQQ